MRRRRYYPRYPGQLGSTQCPLCGRTKNPDFAVCSWCGRFSPEYSATWERRDAYANTFYVYILELNDGSLYVGQTRDLQSRLAGHKAGETATTKNKNPKLIWYNPVKTREQATHLELQLKHTKDEVKRDMIKAFNDALIGRMTSFPSGGELQTWYFRLEWKLNDLRNQMFAVGIVLAILGIALAIWVGRYA